MSALELPGFGPIMSGDEVVTVALTTLQTWLPPAVDALKVAGGPELEYPQHYDAVPLDGVPGQADQIPAVFTSSPGLASKVVKAGDTYGAWWVLRAVVVDRDEDWALTARRSKWWAALVRTVLLQHPEFKTEWTGEQYGRIAGGENRTLGGCIVTFQCWVGAAVRIGNAGPLYPPAAPVIDITEASFDVSEGIPI